MNVTKARSGANLAGSSAGELQSSGRGGPGPRWAPLGYTGIWLALARDHPLDRSGRGEMLTWDSAIALHPKEGKNVDRQERGLT